MPLPLEIKALGWALLVGAISLGSALLAGTAIRAIGQPNSAPETASSESTPEPALSPALAAEGHQFFVMSCAECHGDDAHGDEGPDLHNLSISNARIAATIRKGVKGEMPNFTKKYTDRQVSALVSYLRTLR